MSQSVMNAQLIEFPVNAYTLALRSNLKHHKVCLCQHVHLAKRMDFWG